MSYSLNEFEQIDMAKHILNSQIAKKLANGLDDKDEELNLLIADRNKVDMGDSETIQRILNQNLLKSDINNLKNDIQ